MSAFPSFSDLRQANRKRGAEWFGRKLNLTDNLFTHVELGGEVGEVQELLMQILAQSLRLGTATGKALNWSKKLDRHQKNRKGGQPMDTVREALKEELADVVICVDNIAQAFDIDLGAAVRDKFNATSTKYGLQTRLQDGAMVAPLVKALSDLKARVAHAKEPHVAVPVGTLGNHTVTVPASTVLKSALVLPLPKGFSDMAELSASLKPHHFDALKRIGKWAQAPAGVSGATLSLLERRGLIQRRFHPDCPAKVRKVKSKLTSPTYQWAWTSLAK